MKNIYKSILTLAGAAAIFASCVQEAKPLASAVSVNKTELEFEAVDAPAQDVTVTADGDWFAVAPEWITVEPALGSGETQVKISVSPNLNGWKEINGPRNATVSFCYGTSDLCVLSVKQKGENGLDSSRQYSLVQKADDFEAGSYLIVFDNAGQKSALALEKNSSESTYQYMKVVDVTESEGVIATQNATNAFSFEAVEGGYTIKMSNGSYLLIQNGKNGFYSTTETAKASVWTVEFDEQGVATIKTGDYFIQLSLNYGTAGAYNSPQDNALMPSLYKDSKPASDEILVLPESVSVVASATSASIAVQSNKTWKVRCHDEWISKFTTSGEGNGTIELAFEANSSKEESRTASIQVIGETTSFTIAFVQNKIATSVAEIVAQLTSTDSKNQSPYEVDLTDAGAVVSYVNGKNAFIEDKTGGILLYKEGHGLTAGMKISGTVKGSGYLYSKLPEITSIDGAKTEAGGDIPLTELTLAELLSNYDRYINCRVLLKGVTVTDAIDSSDRDGRIEQDSKGVAVRAQSKTLSMPEGTCDYICFPSIYNTNKQLSLFENGQCTYTSNEE